PAPCPGLVRGRDDERGGAVRDGARVRRGHRAVLRERGLEPRDLVHARIARLLVGVHADLLALPAAHRHGDDLRPELAVAYGLLGAGERRDGEAVLRLAREAVL